MRSEELISIIVPIYNAESTICKCLDCILKQTYTDFELLLIDDGSTDQSGKICDFYSQKDTRIKVFHKVNGGVSSARNLGLDNVQGNWITFADADDYMEENWLQDFFTHTNEADIIFQNAIWHYQDGRTFLRSVSVDDNLSYQEKLAILYPKSFLGYIWATLFKTDIVRQHNLRFNPCFKFKEDRDFVLRYCKYATSLKVLPCRNYHYNFPPSNNRAYSKPDISRVVLEICEKENIMELIGEELSKGIITDVPILWELVRLYSCSQGTEDKKEALQLVYKKRPLSVTGRGTLAIIAFCINHFPENVTHLLMLLLSKIRMHV